MWKVLEHLLQEELLKNLGEGVEWLTLNFCRPRGCR